MPPSALNRSAFILALVAASCGGSAVSNRSEDDGEAGAGATNGTDCPGVREGDVTVTTPAELERLRGVGLVTGDLDVVCAECETLEPLGCLAEVGRMLVITGCDRLESLAGLSRLRRLGLRDENGGLGLGFHFQPFYALGNARLKTLEGLGPLERVEGRVHVFKNPVLADLSGIAAVSDVAGAFYVEENPSLESLESLRGLRSVRAGLSITDNDALVDLTGLEDLWAVGNLAVSNNDSLRTLAGLNDFLELTWTPLIAVLGNPVLEDVSQLSRIGGTLHAIRFTDNAALREIVLSEYIEVIESDLTIRENAGLERFELPGFAYGGDVSIQRNPALSTLDIGAPIAIGNLSFAENGALFDTSAFDEVRLVDGYVLIDNDPTLERVGLPELQEVTDFLEIRSNASLRELGLDSLRRAEWISITNNPDLPSCVVTQVLSTVTTPSPPMTCENGPDECFTECPPRP
jgi:hypothetical protein